MNNRDMMYSGYYQGFPGNMAYGNFGMQTPPGGLMNMINTPPMYQNNDTTSDIINKINELEKRIKALEAKTNTTNINNYTDDSKSMYML